MSDPRISRKTASTALVYLKELLLYVHDTPEDLEKCMSDLEKARDTNPCICGCCDGSDCGQTKKPDCDLCQDRPFICQICDEVGEIEVKGMCVMCPACSGWPNRCPDCGAGS